MRSVETERQINNRAEERARRVFVQPMKRFAGRGNQVNAVTNDKDSVPPPVISAPPEKELEHKLQKDPENPDAKVDVGSDESMDASDPPSAAQPGCGDDPVPSSSFPEGK